MVKGYDGRSTSKGYKYNVRPMSSLGASNSDETYPNRITLKEINSFVKPKAINQNVMITICDKGYLSVFRLFYRINRMEQYSNFIVFVMDKEGYDVSFLFFLYS